MSEYVPTTDEVRAAWMTAGPPSSTVVRAVEFDRYLAAEKRKWRAEALRGFADSINLEALAEEWEGPDGEGHWSAGNAASAVQMAARTRADRIEQQEGA